MARCIDCGFLTRRAIGAGSLSVDDVTIPPAGRAEIRDRRAHQVEFLACFLGLANFHDGCPDVAGTRDASGGYTPNLAFEQCAMTNVTRRRRCGAFRRFRPGDRPSEHRSRRDASRTPVGERLLKHAGASMLGGAATGHTAESLAGWLEHAGALLRELL